MRQIGLIVAFLCVARVSATAQADSRRIGGIVSGAAAAPVGDFNAQGANGYQVTAGTWLRLDSKAAWQLRGEVGYSRFYFTRSPLLSSALTTPGNLQYGFTVSLERRFRLAHALRPYLLGGLGYQETKGFYDDGFGSRVEGAPTSGPLVQGGGGVEWRMRGVGLRLESRFVGFFPKGVRSLTGEHASLNYVPISLGVRF